MQTPVPRIVIEPPPRPAAQAVKDGSDPVLSLIDLLRAPGSTVRTLDLARALIAEGKSFAETPSGRRWAALLSRSTLVENGWLLWNQANLDLPLQSGDDALEAPSAMLEEILRRIMAGDVEHYVSVLGALLAEEAASRPSPERQ